MAKPALILIFHLSFWVAAAAAEKEASLDPTREYQNCVTTLGAVKNVVSYEAVPLFLISNVKKGKTDGLYFLSGKGATFLDYAIIRRSQKPGRLLGFKFPVKGAEDFYLAMFRSEPPLLYATALGLSRDELFARMQMRPEECESIPPPNDDTLIEEARNALEKAIQARLIDFCLTYVKPKYQLNTRGTNPLDSPWDSYLAGLDEGIKRFEAKVDKIIAACSPVSNKPDFQKVIKIMDKFKKNFLSKYASRIKPLVVISYSGAGKTPSIVHVFENGAVTCTTCSNTEFPPGTLDSRRLTKLLDSVGTIDSIKEGKCECPSWGCESLFVVYQGKGTGNIECIAENSPPSHHALLKYVKGLPEQLRRIASVTPASSAPTAADLFRQ